MIVYFGNKISWKLFWKPYYRAKEYLDRLYFRHRKKVYTCFMCGLKEAPFLHEKFNGLHCDFGWEMTDEKHWICHHCLCHSGDQSAEDWNTFVKINNERLKIRLQQSRWS